MIFAKPISFNSRTRVGATSKNAVNADPGSGFNSRTRVGATRADSRPERSIDGFNSRTRVGATVFDRAKWTHLEVSIHAPVWVRPSVRA